MRGRRSLAGLLVAVAAVSSAGCGSPGEASPAELGAGGSGVGGATTQPAPTAATTTTIAATVATTTTALPPPTTTTTAVTVVTTVAPPARSGRQVYDQPWIPFAQIEQVILAHPASKVELIGFHESNIDGARQLESLPSSAPNHILQSRSRDTGGRTAADVVVDPEAEIRAPVSGRVISAGTYVLYCDYSDDYVVIEPDSHPGWEVTLLHIDGVTVGPGDRVEAGVTVVAPRATRLPFPSQVDELTAKPSWPHVHIEVIDPSIPDRPSGRSC